MKLADYRVLTNILVTQKGIPMVPKTYIVAYNTKTHQS